jgi:PAS domain S-box-containing protein
LEKAESIFKNLKESSKIDETGNKYNDNAETSIVIISGTDDNLGTVVHTNNFVLKLLGYKRSELIGVNVAGIMPKVFGETHNTVLSKYLESSS